MLIESEFNQSFGKKPKFAHQKVLKMPKKAKKGKSKSKEKSKGYALSD